MAAITKTNMRMLAAIMAKRRSSIVHRTAREEREWKEIVHELSQEIVAGADCAEFLSRCNGTFR